VTVSAESVMDESMMDEALRLARRGAELGELGIAAVVLDDNGTVVAGRFDEVRSSGDPTAHAVVLALRDASKVTGSWRLLGARLFVTREPCAMCAGAVLSARVARVVYAAADDLVGCLGSRYHFGVDPRLNHDFDVVSGVRSIDAVQVYEESLRLS
jgi:tRNA(adenine34) deaminase